MNTSLLLTLPVVTSLITAFLVYTCQRHSRLINQISVTGAGLNLAFGILLSHAIITQGPQAVAFGDWAAPFGIIFVADLLSAALVLITTIIGLVIVVYSMADLASKPSYRLYHMLFHTLLAGVNGAFLTGDLFNLYVWFEVMLISAFGLMILDGSREQIDGGVKYVILNLISTLVLLLSIGLLYGATGTLNMADLHIKAALMPPEQVRLLASLFLFAFAIKSALFPVFAWLPASYHTMPSAVVALFAALLTKVGVYALIRLFTLIFGLQQTGLQPLLLWIAGLTMLIGVLGATSFYSIKKILSFHIISQIGYMMMGLAVYTPLAITGAVFYLIHHIIVKANLFLIGGILQRRHGSDELARLGGAYKSMPFLAALFLVPAFSLAGFPPLSGFWGKFFVIKGGLEAGDYWLSGTALLVSLLTIFSMTKIWAAAFWKPAPDDTLNTASVSKPNASLSWWDKQFYYWPVAVLSLLTITIGLAVQPLYKLAESAADQLLVPDAYLQAVLGYSVPGLDRPDLTRPDLTKLDSSSPTVTP